MNDKITTKSKFISYGPKLFSIMTETPFFPVNGGNSTKSKVINFEISEELRSTKSWKKFIDEELAIYELSTKRSQISDFLDNNRKSINNFAIPNGITGIDTIDVDEKISNDELFEIYSKYFNQKNMTFQFSNKGIHFFVESGFFDGNSVKSYSFKLSNRNIKFDVRTVNGYTVVSDNAKYSSFYTFFGKLDKKDYDTPVIVTDIEQLSELNKNDILSKTSHFDATLRDTPEEQSTEADEEVYNAFKNKKNNNVNYQVEMNETNKIEDKINRLEQFNNNFRKGNRGNTIFSLLCLMRLNTYSKDDALKHLNRINNNSSHPIESSRVFSTLCSVYDGERLYGINNDGFSLLEETTGIAFKVNADEFVAKPRKERNTTHYSESYSDLTKLIEAIIDDGRLNKKIIPYNSILKIFNNIREKSGNKRVVKSTFSKIVSRQIKISNYSPSEIKYVLQFMLKNNKKIKDEELRLAENKISEIDKILNTFSGKKSPSKNFIDEFNNDIGFYKYVDLTLLLKMLSYKIISIKGRKGGLLLTSKKDVIKRTLEYINEHETTEKYFVPFDYVRKLSLGITEKFIVNRKRKIIIESRDTSPGRV